MRPHPWVLVALCASTSGVFLACGAAFTAGEATDGGTDGPGADASYDTRPALDGPPGSDGDAISEVGAGDVRADAVIGPPKTVFVTSKVSSGNLGGLSGADAMCQSLAGQASLLGTYKAWLSSTTSSAASRLTHSTGPYVLVNGVPVATSWTGLTHPPLLSAIDIDENGSPAPPAASGTTSGPGAWTATNPDGSLGTVSGATCTDWTTAGPSNGAVLGFADRTDQSWTAGCSAQGAGSTICGGNAALYCFEQ